MPTFFHNLVVRAGLEPDTVQRRIRQPYNFSRPNGYGPWCFSDSGTVPHYAHLTIFDLQSIRCSLYSFDIPRG
jgi:hypothetical protein